MASGCRIAPGTATIGVVIPDLNNPLFPPIVRGIEDVLDQAGYSALIANTDSDPAREQAQVASRQPLVGAAIRDRLRSACDQLGQRRPARS